MNVESILEKLEDVRASTLERFARLSQNQLDARPPNVGDGQPWSLGEVFMHVALDEVYLREFISRPLLEGIIPPEGITFLPPPPPYAMEKDAIRFWFARARSQTQAYLRSWPVRWNVDQRHEGGLRPMNALEWMVGYGGHEAFHHRQLDELISWCTETGVS